VLVQKSEIKRDKRRVFKVVLLIQKKKKTSSKKKIKRESID